ncbi:MAG: flagellar export protein FliJ [Lachnospiraceae bacterium]|nr:flagellar export protein FliJ [Lachnospiraceae bacterium]
MAKFRYKMQNILNVKEKLEDQAKNEFSLAVAERNEEQEKLEKLLIKQSGYEARLKELSLGALDFHEIRTCKEAINTMKRLIRDQMIRLSKAERKVELQRQKLNLAQQERKTHDKLKEKAFEVFLDELNKEEMKQIDELTSFKYGMNDGKPDEETEDDQ